MRVFLIGWEGQDELIDVADGFLRHGHAIAYWTLSAESRKKITASRFPGTIFHDLEDALALRPAVGISEKTFDPPSERLLSELFSTACMVLTMMHKKYEWMSIDERKHFFYRLVRYWHGVLGQFRPDAIIFPVAPHTVYDFVLYALAKHAHVKTIFFELTRMHDRLLLSTDYMIGSDRLAKLIEANRDRSFALSDLTEDIRAEYLLQQDSSIDATTKDVKLLVDAYSGYNAAKIKWRSMVQSVANGTIARRLFRLFQKPFSSNLKKEYLRVQRPPDFGKKFVYAALHYQPECSTAPLGGVFIDQILMVETIAATLPSGWEIYVKEHPVQWGPRGYAYSDYRYPGYYDMLSRIPGVRIVPLHTDRYALIRNARAVATASGTAGWEAILRSRPALVFGHPWYRHAPGVFRVQSADDCREAFRAIENGFVIDQQSVIDYLRNFELASFHGYLDDYWKGISRLTKEQNVEYLLSAILAEMARTS